MKREKEMKTLRQKREGKRKEDKDRRKEIKERPSHRKPGKKKSAHLKMSSKFQPYTLYPTLLASSHFIDI